MARCESRSASVGSELPVLAARSGGLPSKLPLTYSSHVSESNPVRKSVATVVAFHVHRHLRPTSPARKRGEQGSSTAQDEGGPSKARKGAASDVAGSTSRDANSGRNGRGNDSPKDGPKAGNKPKDGPKTGDKPNGNKKANAKDSGKKDGGKKDGGKKDGNGKKRGDDADTVGATNGKVRRGDLREQLGSASLHY
ncbi:unnamed protein product [Peniophora sp. CBMAI 1063]|nr:unnamed protein product [Peniophora sp. CBMAI 1063]